MKRLVALLAVALVTACTTAPMQETPELADVRETHRAVSAVPEIRANAAFFLHQADEAIRRAGRTYDAAEHEHQIYTAHRYLDIAQAVTNRELSEREVERLADLHNKLRRELRAEKEAKTARRAEELAAELAALEAARVDGGVMVTLQDVVFTPGRADLAPAAKDEIKILSAFLRHHPDRSMIVEGHTDNSGNADYNQVLSERRASAVKQALVAQGIEPERIVSHGYGETRPVASNTTEIGRQLNRRVAVVILTGSAELQEPD